MSAKAPTKDPLLEIASGLRAAARRPTVYGYKPHPKQLDFHQSPATTKLFVGGNRSGKTVGGAVEVVWTALGKHPYIQTPPPPVRIRVVTVDFLQGLEKIIKPEIARWCPLSELKGNSWATAWDGQTRTLYFANQSFIEFMSYEQEIEKFAGTSRHLIWMDEEPPRDIWIECRMRTIDVQGRMILTMTPLEGLSWTFDEIYSKAPTDENIHVTQVDIEENIYVSQSEVDAYLAGLTADERQARKEGKYVAMGGLIYKKFNPEIHVVDPFIPPKEWLHVASMDHGFNNPTAWGWAAVDRDGRVFLYDGYSFAERVVSWHAKEVKRREKERGITPAYYVGDPSIRNRNPITGTSVQLEYIENGIPIMEGNNEVEAGIVRVAGLLEAVPPKLYITRNCVDAIWEIQRYRWGAWSTRKMRSDRNKKEEPHKKHDHQMDMIRYLVMSRPQVDDGTVILDKPISPDMVGASVAVSGGEPIRDYGRAAENALYSDFHLGSES